MPSFRNFPDALSLSFFSTSKSVLAWPAFVKFQQTYSPIIPLKYQPKDSAIAPRAGQDGPFRTSSRSANFPHPAGAGSPIHPLTLLVLFSNFGNGMSVSGSNVVFEGTYSTGSGIFLDSGGSLVPIVTSGESLFGGKIESVSIGTSAMSGNEIAFDYTLTTGTNGIGIAIVPEPSTWAALLGGVGILAGFTRFGRRIKV